MASGAGLTVLQGLRWWAQGDLADQAAVELLARSFGGRYLQPGKVWVRRCRRPGWYWLDADALADLAATRVGDEREVLALAVRLLNGDPATRARRPVSSGRAAA